MKGFGTATKGKTRRKGRNRVMRLEKMDSTQAAQRLAIILKLTVMKEFDMFTAKNVALKLSLRKIQHLGSSAGMHVWQETCHASAKVLFLGSLALISACSRSAPIVGGAGGTQSSLRPLQNQALKHIDRVLLNKKPDKEAWDFVKLTLASSEGRQATQGVAVLSAIVKVKPNEWDRARRMIEARDRLFPEEGLLSAVETLPSLASKKPSRVKSK